LPQGFKNSPTIFGTALASDLKAFSADQHGCTFLQYVDDLLLPGPTQEDCMEGTCFLLSLLWKAGREIMSTTVKQTNKKTQSWGSYLETRDGSPRPEVKTANEITRDYVWDKLYPHFCNLL
jgi:hypothetical protein